MTYATMGEALRAWRHRAGLRQIDVESALQIEQTRLSGWEVGRNRAPVPELTKLAKHYGVSAEELGQTLYAFRDSTPESPDPS